MSTATSTKGFPDLFGALVEQLEQRAIYRYGAALAFGLLASLSHAPVHLSAVLIVGLSALVLLIDASRAAKRPLADAAFVGWLFGVGMCLPAYAWIANPFYVEADKYAFLAPVAVIGMGAGMALFIAFSAMFAARFWTSNWTRVLVLAVAWSAGELLRGYILTGFPWNLVVYSWTNEIESVQLASVVGPYGLGLIYVALCSLPAVALRPRCRTVETAPPSPQPILIGPLVAMGFGLLAVYGFGAARLAVVAQPAAQAETTVRLINPNVEQRLKFLPNGETRLFEQAVGLGQTSASSDVDMIVWPEATTSFDLAASDLARQYIGEMLQPDQLLLAGSSRIDFNRVESRRLFHNSLQVFDTEGEVEQIYDKSHLVPFGEYVPIKWFFNTIGFEQLTRARGALTPGGGLETIAADGAPSFSPLICYEAIFPGYVVGSGRRPDFLLNVSDDSWFGKGWGPRQHFVSAQMRTVEEGLPMVRAANQGVTAVIDPLGRIVKRLEPETEGAIDAVLPAPLAPTLYAMLGDWMSLLVLMLAGGIAWRFRG